MSSAILLKTMQVLRRECKKSVIFFFLPRKEYQFRLKYLKTEVILKLKSYKKFCKHLFELGKIPRIFGKTNTVM